MKSKLYIFIQCSWGLLQTLLGACAWLLFCPGSRPQMFYGALVLRWKKSASASLGLFLFLSDTIAEPALFSAMRVHEYGHFIQSLMLGPLYLPLAALPSMLWCCAPVFRSPRNSRGYSYYSFYTERWADRLGEKALGELSMARYVSSRL